MKKLLCLALSLLMCAAIFTGCGKFDMENADLSAYVELSDISEFSYADMCAAYEAYRETLSVDLESCALTTGYTIDFFVTAQLGDETIDAWTHNTESDMIKGYDVYRNPSAFDFALCYNVERAEENSNKARTVKIGEDFSFSMTVPADYEDASLAGKTVTFTVNVKKAIPAVYPDSYIADKLANFYAAVSKSKDVVELGDTITMDFTGRIDGALFDGGTGKDYVIVVGEGSLIPGFEEQLIGHKLKETFDITVTFPEDYDEESLAGKEAVFSIKVKDIYNDTALITNNTPFADMWELKYAFRVESYLDYAMVDYVQDQSTLIELPEKLVKDFEKLFKSYVNREVAEEVLSLASKGYSYSKKEVKEMLYPDGSDVTYIEEGAKAAAYDYIIAVALLRELNLEYTEKMYQKDLKLFAEEYTEIYGELYTPEKMEELYGEEVLRTSFITPIVTEELITRISDMPEIPG